MKHRKEVSECGQYCDTGLFNDLTPEASGAAIANKIFVDGKYLLDAKSKGESPDSIKEKLIPSVQDELDAIEKQAKAIFEKHAESGRLPPVVEALIDRVSRSHPIAGAVISEFRDSDEYAEVVANAGPTVPPEAPPEAHDAAACLLYIDTIRGALLEGWADVAAVYAIKLGYAKCRMDVRHAEPMVWAGRAAQDARRAGGSATARLSVDERSAVIQARDKLASDNDRPKSWAAKQVGAQLRTGTFPGIERAVELSDKYIANLNAER